MWLDCDHLELWLGSLQAPDLPMMRMDYRSICMTTHCPIHVHNDGEDYMITLGLQTMEDNPA